MPAALVEQEAGRHRGNRHRRKNQEVVGGLRFRALRGGVALGEQRGAAYVHEVPADAQQKHRDPEVDQRGARQRRRDAHEQEHDAGQYHVEHAKAINQRAREERRAVHADHVPLEHQRRVVEMMVVCAHRQRRRRHHQVHDAVREHGREHGDDEYRLAHDHAQRPPRILALVLGEPRNIETR
jgi:hypothetical protein